ncbi:MAG: biopolymer transporter ExbD [Candidatus Cloacimonetes bacterium]|nr:biopolymer transporter ExbD [Candidatus Cloacimonadota bacterium]
MKIKLKRERISSVALISFTDVIFLLLIFLLISSNFITRSGLQVQLPSSSSRQNEFNRNLSVTLTSTDEVFIENEYVKWEDITVRLTQMLVNDPEQVVVIRADEDVPLKKVVHLLDEVQKTGTNRFFIATEFEQERK